MPKDRAAKPQRVHKDVLILVFKAERNDDADHLKRVL